MKDKILFAIALMCTVLLTSCGDDDNGSSIVGVWKCKSVDTGGWGNYARSRINVGDIIIFKNDNTYTITGNYNESGEYTVNGNTLTIGAIPYEITVSSTTLTIRLKAFGLGHTFSRYSGSIPSTYNMNVDIDANASSKTIELTDLKTIIATATSSASWLTVSKLSYSSDSRVQIKAVANTSTSSRNCTVTVTAVDGNKVIINVIQNGASDQPQTKDEVSDQQPYSMEVGL